MKMDLSKFKKISSDGKKTVLQHPRGHQIIVAHSSLGKENLSQLGKIPMMYAESKNEDGGTLKMAAGGEVAESDKALKISQAQQDAINDAPVPADQASAQNQGAVGNKSAYASPYQEPGQEYTPPTSGKPYPPAPKYDIPAGGENDPFAMANKTAMQGLQKQQEGAQQMAVAQGEAGTQAATVNSMGANSLNNNLDQFQDQWNKLAAERKAMFADVGNGHVDPQKFIKGMSTGNKILTAIGLVVGGMGSGLTHQPNLASDYLDKQISNDIDAQKTNIENKKSLFSYNLAQTGDLLKAQEMTKMQIMDLTSMQLKRVAAASQDPINRAALLTTSGNLDEKAAELQNQIAMRHLLVNASQQAGSGNEAAFQQKTAVLRAMGQKEAAENLEKKHVPGVGNASRDAPADVVKQIAAQQDLHEKLTDLAHFAEQNSGSLNPSVVNQGHAKMLLAQNAMRLGQDMGVVKASEVELMNKMLGDPTQFLNKYRSLKGYQEVMRDNLNSLNNIKKSYGLPITQQAQEGAKGTPEIQMKNGKPYMKVPGGWKAVK